MPQNKLAPTSANALDLAVQNQFGLMPNQDRLSILPRYSRQTGWVAPDILYQAARGFVAPSVAAQGYALTAEDALNTAGAAMGGGMFGSAPINALRSGGGRSEAMRVFHGGTTKVIKPDLNKSGSVSGILDEGRAFWVTPSELSAKRFGEMASKTPVISEFGFTPKNPLIVEYPIKTIFDGNFGQFKIDALNKARKAGHDSVVFRQSGKGEKLIDDEIAIFDPSILQGAPR